MKVFRADRSELSKPVEMSNGWLRVDGYIARSGILEYPRSDGTIWREYRPPEEAFAPATLESFALVPLTNGHPPEGKLTPENTREYQVGTIDQPKQDEQRVRARILITDAQAIADAKAGKVELSCGYTADLDLTPGEIDGQRYDAIQRAVAGNHVALVDAGRAGPVCRIRLDSAKSDLVAFDSDQIGKPADEENVLKKIRIDGVEYEVSEQVAQAIAKQAGAFAHEIEQLKIDVKAKASDLDKLQARADSAEAKSKKLEAELTEAPKKVREQIAARVALETEAGKILGEQKLDGKTDAEIKRLVVEKVLSLKLDGKSEAYVDASYDMAVKNFKADAAEPETRDLEHVDAPAKELTSAQLTELMKQRSRDAFKVKAS